MDIEKEYVCLEKNACVYSKHIDNDEDYQETVPAYCDELFKIVKCSAHSFVTTVDCSSSEVKIFCKTMINLTYYNENMELAYADFEEEFIKNISIDNLSERAFATAHITDKYTNFRVINQKRIDIHIACDIFVKAYDRDSSPCLTSCSSSKLRLEKINSADIVATANCKAEFDDEFPIPADSKPIKRIVNCFAYPQLTETKIINDKMLVKTNLNISILYTADDTNCECIRCCNTIEVSKIIDAVGIQEGDIPIVTLDLCNVYFKPKCAGDDRLTVVEIYGDLAMSCVFVREAQETLVTDGYVLNRECTCKYSDYRCVKNGKFLTDTVMKNISFDFGTAINCIKDFSISLSAPCVRNEKIAFKATACALCCDSDNVINSLNNSVDIEIAIDGYEDALTSVWINSVDYSIVNDTRIDVRLSLSYTAYCFSKQIVKVLNEIEASDECINFPALTVYFGKKSESVWSIAKSFSSDIDMIMKENNLENEILDTNKVLIIPGI